VIGSVLVTDGEQRSALAVVRSLGKAGHRVFVCSESGRSIAGASRYAAEERAVASSIVRPAEFANELSALALTWGIDLLIPMTEQAYNAVFANSELFRAVRILGASAEQFKAISDKQNVLEVAASCGIGVPAQVVLSSPYRIDDFDARRLGFPIVVKPARSVAPDGGRQLKLGVTHCEDLPALRRALASIPEPAYPLLLQQRVIGPGVGIFMLLWDGELVAKFAHRRLREKPPSGGVSVYRESIAADPRLVERSHELLDRFRWRGVAMVEYKIDQRTGMPFLMEINGRFWGSLQLAIDAGVDFPALFVARMNGQKVYGPAEYRLGIRSRWEWGDVDYFLSRLRHSNPDLSLPPGAPGRLRALVSSLVPWKPGDRLEVFRLDDPRPFLRETGQYFRQ
jgi:predicted ATP-grasp superfamily ATP-dependent carboligase